MNEKDSNAIRPTTLSPLVPPLEWRGKWFFIAQLIALVVMMLTTWRLWFEIPGFTYSWGIEFPRIPVLQFLVGTPRWVSNICGCMVILAALFTIIFELKKRELLSRICSGLVLIGLAGAVLLNQHRFLPWVYQSLLLLFAILALSRVDFFRFARMLVVSIYIFSAISKFDYQFLETTGRNMLAELLEMVNSNIQFLPPNLVLFLVFSFPLIELLVGIGLLISRYRVIAMFLGIGMHSALLLVLGPLGLENAASVLIWNGLFVVQLPLLFWPVKLRSSEMEQRPTVPIATQLGKIAIGVLFVIPVLEKVNLVDHWPAWGLYAPRASRTKIYISEWKAMKLPIETRKYVKKVGGKWSNANMVEFNLAAWSIKQKNVPVYPQDRFQFGLAAYLIEKYDLHRTFVIEIQSTSNRFTGKRYRREISDANELKDVQFMFNTKAY